MSKVEGNVRSCLESPFDLKPETWDLKPQTWHLTAAGAGYVRATEGGMKCRRMTSVSSLILMGFVM